MTEALKTDWREFWRLFHKRWGSDHESADGAEALEHARKILTARFNESAGPGYAFMEQKVERWEHWREAMEAFIPVVADALEAAGKPALLRCSKCGLLIQPVIVERLTWPCPDCKTYTATRYEPDTQASITKTG